MRGISSRAEATPFGRRSLAWVYRREGLRIGDVGVVVPEDGSFDVLFNICLPPSHSLHRRAGVPPNFTPVELGEGDIAIFPEAESVGRVISTASVAWTGEQSSNEGTTRVSRPGPLNYEFTLSSKEGALLILPEGAERYYLRNQRPFLEEAIQHAFDWYDFAEGRLGRIISHDALYLITGFYKTCSWSLASYQQASAVSGARAQFKAVQVGGGNISRSYTWVTTNALDWRVGPSDRYYNGTPNQSVFIQGFKIAVRSNILGTKRVKVKEDIPSVRSHRVTFYGGLRRSNIKTRSSSNWVGAPAANIPGTTDAGTHKNTLKRRSDSGSSVLDDVDEDIVIQHTPQVPNPFHPSDVINRYLLRSHPSAVTAITHDDQWTTLLERGLARPEELVQEDHLEYLAGKMFPVSQEGAVYLPNLAPDGNAGLNALNNEVVDAQRASVRLPEEICTAKHGTRATPPESVDRQSTWPNPVAAEPHGMRNAFKVLHDTPPQSTLAAGPAKPLRVIKPSDREDKMLDPKAVGRYPVNARQVGFETAVTVVIFTQKLKVAVARSHSRLAKPRSRTASVGAAYPGV